MMVGQQESGRFLSYSRGKDVGLEGRLQFFYFVASSRESRGLWTSGINPRTIKSFVFA